jgi:hypothetical protein
MEPVKHGERLIAYYGADPHHVESDLNDILDYGCTGIVFCVTEIDVDLFLGRIEAVMKSAERLNLDVYLNFWGLGGCFATNLMPSKYLCHNPEVRRIGFEKSKTIDSENGGNISRGCINNPEFINWIQDFTAKTMANYPIKGVFWDEPKHGYCCCKYCRIKFEKLYSRPMPDDKENLDVKKMFNDDMTDFLLMLLKHAKNVRPDIKNMLCLMTTTQEELGEKNLDKLLSCPALDIYGTDPYWIHMKKDFTWMRAEIKKAIDLCKKHKKFSHIWVQCHDIPAGREHEIYEATFIIAEYKPDIIAAWGFKGLNNNFKSPNPEKCWQELGKAYLEIARTHGGH